MKLTNCILLATTVLVLAACGSSSSDDNITATYSGSAPGITFSVTDAPIDGFATLSLSVSEVVLINTDDEATANLLPAPREFNFLGLANRQALLMVEHSIPDGTYSKVRLTIDSASGRDTSGVLQNITLGTTTATAELTAFGNPPLGVSKGVAAQSLIDIDLANSLSNDPLSPGDFIFDLAFTVTTELGSNFQDFRARVVEVNRTASRFTARIIDDSQTSARFGLIEVIVDANTYMLNDDNDSDHDGYEDDDDDHDGHDDDDDDDHDGHDDDDGHDDRDGDGLETNDVVQVNGDLLANGQFKASRVIVEDDHDRNGGGFRFEIEGEVQSVDLGASTFELLIFEIEKGASTINSVIGDLGIITVAFDANTRIVSDDFASSSVGNAASVLIPGLEVDVRFDSFAAPSPFLADSLQIGDGHDSDDSNDGIEYEGAVSSTTGMPIGFDFAISQPLASSGSVFVSMAGVNEITLDAGGEPSVSASLLTDNLRLEIYGDLSGSNLAAFKIEIDPGELEGELQNVDLLNSQITVDVIEVERHWGGATNLAAQVATFDVAPECRIKIGTGFGTLADLADALALGGVNVKAKGVAATVWEITVD
ncbi:MAG: DUF4382 domain-containing protein [Planctomycetes bacterium]|nr:DUF4382 domain-containing protein [Planctomycetota bacterium]